MNKLYGLRYVKDEGSYWEEHYAFSHDPQKLRALVKGVSHWMTGSSDITNSTKEVCYTDKGTYPRYSVEEVPFVI